MKSTSNKYRSGLEVTVSKQLLDKKIDFEYEKTKINYIIPESSHIYNPDFRLKNKEIYIETKGRFTLADRKKHLLIKAQRPDLDIRFIFSNSNTPIRKGSKTTYADWCDKNGFTYADKVIPTSWV